ncbi:MAG: hypothetical protein CL811_01110 [Colwelliaceae bacterium]|nr:hypothetical protein [Colwelliaceae bacterium]|tara:strand:+ start:2667 stop:3530 length:864 start_codon:yes stop_codon:yes gene_type:complete
MENIYERKDAVENYGLSREIPEGILKSYADQIAEKCNPERILDAGFGTGTVLVPLVESLEGKVVGIDASKEMVKKVRNTLNDDSVDLIQGDLHDAHNLIGSKVDAVHLKAVTHIPTDPKKFLLSTLDALEVGGYFVIGKEYSQPEDNLESIGKYGNSGEIFNAEFSDFYKEYFDERSKLGIPFKVPEMPAGDFDPAVDFLVGNGYECVGKIRTDEWSKAVTFSEVIKAMELGTFSVFHRGVSEDQSRHLVQHMKEYCDKKGLDLDVEMEFPARLDASILRKVSGGEK